MNLRKNLLIALSIVLMIALGVGYALSYPLLSVAAAYKARLLCIGVFVGGRSEAHVLQNELRDYWYLTDSLDTQARRATASFAGLTSRTAEYHEGRGCVLAHGLQYGGAEQERLPGADPDWPKPVVRSEALDAAVQQWFAPDLFTHAVVVVRDGELVHEAYAPGVDAHTRLLGWSMTKSLVHAQVGRLIQLGLVANTDEPLGVQEWLAHPADARGKITLAQMLHMSSGLKWDEEYFPPSDVTAMLFATRNAPALAAKAPLQHPPGEHWYYSSGTSNLLSRAVAERVPDMANPVYSLLFEPAGMHSAVIETDARGNEVGSSFGIATARDWARFGVLYLNDGVRGGERLLPEGWAAHATTPTAGEPRYGAHWWLNPVMGDSGERYYSGMPGDMFSAEGFDGQYLFVIPSTRTVIVRLGAYGPPLARLSELLRNTHAAAVGAGADGDGVQ